MTTAGRSSHCAIVQRDAESGGGGVLVTGVLLQSPSKCITNTIDIICVLNNHYRHGLLRKKRLLENIGISTRGQYMDTSHTFATNPLS